MLKVMLKIRHISYAFRAIYLQKPVKPKILYKAAITK